MLASAPPGDDVTSGSRLGSPRLLDLVHDAVIVRDLALGTVRYWNHGAEALYGWQAAEALHRDPLQLLRTECTVPLPGITAAVARHGLWEGVLRQTARGGEVRTVASRWMLRDDERGRVILQADRDITLAISAARAEEVRRLGELATLRADFSAMVAHELDAPVAAIARLADALALGEHDPVAQSRILVAIQAEAALLTTLAADARQAALAERDDFVVHPRPTPLAAILTDALAYAATLPGAHPLRVCEGTPRGARVLADPQRIGQVLRNLLSNAAKYSPDGAPIEIRAEPHEGGGAQLSVADRGYGIAPDDLRRILEKFGRGRDRCGHRVPGFGLGLYLSRRILQSHGSDFAIESIPGCGSTFGFSLEYARDPSLACG